MARRLLILLTLISVLTYSGCGWGKPTTGTIRGTISLPSDTVSSDSFNISSSNLVPVSNFPKVPLRKSQYTQQSVSNEKIVKLRPGLNATEAATVIAGLGGTIKKKLYGTESTYLITVNDQIFSKSAAIQNSEIEYIEDNVKFQAFAIPNDEYFKSPYYWNYNMINLPAAWDEQKGNSTVIVAVVDTGISLTHPDLKDNLVSGYDFVDNDDDPSDTKYDEKEGDVRFSHGTHVAGIISAVTNNGIGIAGVAWNVKIMPVRVLGPDGNGYISDIIDGINWAVNHGANVINLSLGGQGNPEDFPTFRTAIDNAIAKGVTVVAAAGNENTGVAFPANYDPVIAVSALDETGAKASYSNYGPEIDLCAPGGKGEPIDSLVTQTILSTTYDKLDKKDGYVFMSGTSMAAPHVSGVVALLYSWGITNPADIENVLKTTADNMGNINYYGAGKVNAFAAVTGVIAAVKIFYYKLPDTKTPSSFYRASINGSYTISSLQPGQYIVCAFVDKNNDGVVSMGDISGISTETTVTSGSTTTVNLNLSEVTTTSSDTVKEYFQKLLSPKE